MTPLKFKIRESSIRKTFRDDYFYISDGRGRYLHKDLSIENTCGEDNFFETKEEAQGLLDEYLDKFKKETKTEKNMQIKDKIVCIDNQDSDSLEYGAEYIIVDINQHGNLGLKNPSTGSLLNHYYKPNRFKMAKREPIEVKLLVNIKTNRVFLRTGQPVESYLKVGDKLKQLDSDLEVRLFREVTED